MIITFQILTGLLLLSGFFMFRDKTGKRTFQLSLIRVLAGVPILIGEYVFVSLFPANSLFFLCFATELLFMLIWFETLLFLETSSDLSGKWGRMLLFSELPAVLIFIVAFVYSGSYPIGSVSEPGGIIYRQGFLFFMFNFLMMVSIVGVLWRLEIYWRNFTPQNRWMFKYLFAGGFLVSVILGFASAYRFSYHMMHLHYFQFLAACLVLAWLMMGYAVIRHRMFNKKIFISRKVVYASVAPLAFLGYIAAIGLVSMLMKWFAIPFPVVLKWFLVVAGIVFVCLMALSVKVRRNIKFFISTHFYINKYEYRDEWLLFSRLLKDSFTETEVVDSLYLVLAGSLYTNGIFIWLENEDGEYAPISHRFISTENKMKYRFSKEHPLISHLKTHAFHYTETANQKKVLFSGNLCGELDSRDYPVLFVPMTIGEQMVGMVGLAAELTGGSYGHDDFDLLTAICTQAASAILSARMAEKAARHKQQEAWDAMSAFILHDMKNASGMLSLVRQNAPKHIHDPEFQQDMLETIDDALKRMDKVGNRMALLNRDIVPVFREIGIGSILTEKCSKMERRLQELSVEFEGDETAILRTDPELLTQIIENILLNAFEACGGQGARVCIYISDGESSLVLSIADNGPGIARELPRDKIFKPFYTTKSKGTGIGLWQVKRLVTILGGDVVVENSDRGGARFVISLPKNLS